MRKDAYHIEYAPVTYPRVITSPNSFQHPESDPNFMAATRITEACSIVKGSCDECDIKTRCEELFNYISDQGRDRPVKEDQLIEYVTRFVFLITGVNRC